MTVAEFTYSCTDRATSQQVPWSTCLIGGLVSAHVVVFMWGLFELASTWAAAR